MFDDNVLIDKIRSLDGRDYGACQGLLGEYDFSNRFKLIIHKIPKDPYAPPHTGVYRIQLSRSNKQIINYNINSRIKRIAFTDYLSRKFYKSSRHIASKNRGTGYSGIITIDQPGQAILERNSVVVSDRYIEVRCFLGIPARGRKINSKVAEKMFIEELPEIVSVSFDKKNIEFKDLERHIHTAEDAEFLRNRLEDLGLVSFVANGSILPRKSSQSDKPMESGKIVYFQSPSSLEVEIQLPNAGRIKGMGIPKGITLITGGGYHGKSTLLETLESAVYNHVPGDGREQCVSLLESVKVRAYSGRNITKTNISSFINNLPLGKDTESFSSNNASGSTSQAASIIEAIEVDAKVLFMDEDTCATNFMNRDKKMKKLIKDRDEPITTFIDKVDQIFIEKNVSTILALGGVGDYFDVSHLVIQMKNYQPIDETKRAHEISNFFSNKKEPVSSHDLFCLSDRCPLPDTIVPKNKSGRFSLKARGLNKIQFGKENIDLKDVEQIIEFSQTRALCYALEYSKRYMDNETCLRDVIKQVINDINETGLDIISNNVNGNFAYFRGFELAFTLNRFSGFDVKQKVNN
tara:strand:+ start:185 stop:1915 length:1731 start_codon:yes stop_codon:yes gene_type:complete